MSHNRSRTGMTAARFRDLLGSGGVSRNLGIVTPFFRYQRCNDVTGCDNLRDWAPLSPYTYCQVGSNHYNDATPNINGACAPTALRLTPHAVSIGVVNNAPAAGLAVVTDGAAMGTGITMHWGGAPTPNGIAYVPCMADRVGVPCCRVLSRKYRRRTQASCC